MCRKLIYLISFVLVLGLISNASAELVAHWKLDEGSGTTAVDATGNGNDGTLEGDPQWVVGYFVEALQFAGSPDRVVVPFSAQLNPEEALTFSVWANVEPGSSGWRSPITSRDDYPQRGYIIYAGTDGNWQFWIGTGSGWSTAAGPPIQTGEWTHVAAVYTPGNQKLYINGELAGEASGTISLNTDKYLSIGAGRTDMPNGDYFFAGMVDDVRVYNHAQTEDEIRAGMTNQGGAMPQAYGPEPRSGTLHEDTWINLSWRPGDFAVSHDVYLGDNFDDVSAGAESTYIDNQAGTFIVAGFPGFAFPDGLVPGTTYYWRIDEVNDTEPNSPWKGDVWSFSIPPKTAYAPDPADNAELVATDASISWTVGFGAKLHTVYFGDNFDDVNNAAGGLPQGTTTYDPGPLELAKTYYWRVDEFDIIDTYKGTVWSFTTEGAVANPDPSNGAVDVKQTSILTWSPSVFAASHEVYFGADKDAVKNADTGSPEYKGTRALGSETYDPGMLEWDSTYYWRIDEVNNTNPDSPWTGILWSFTTANFLIVDDFEDYDVGNNEIWWSWIDGLGYASHPTLSAHPGNGTGSMVGDENTASYTEETIVHGGNQSMPVFYDNSVLRYSEVEKTLTYPRDWTENGVNTLTIWFRGLSDNAAETLYVALNGSAVVTHDNPDAAQITAWTEWTIDLQAFADQGVNLANVNTIAIGLGNKKNPVAGGSGKIYIDDIRLYPPPEPAP